jgi:REP element-mobilizing transposase RayT
VGHSYTSSLFHVVFSTKGRQKCLDMALRERLFPYLGGVAKQHRMIAMAIGGIEDHVHLLLQLPADMALAKAVQVLKSVSSKWIHETFPSQRGFAWQEGYGGFSIAASGVETTVAYIQHQEEHHRTRTFEEEFIECLRRHNMTYDAKHVFG